MACYPPVIECWYKSPGDALDVVFNYAAAWLQGGSISGSSWAQTAGVDALTLAGDSFTTGETQVRVSGGTDGETYRIRNTITLADGQIKEKSLDIIVKEG